MRDKRTQNSPKKSSFSLNNYINNDIMSKKITCLPIDFQYLPVEVLSKEFTKLNNPHPYRIHYLGSRFKNTLQVHKKNAFSEKNPYVYNTELHGEYLPSHFQKNCPRNSPKKKSFEPQFSSQSDTNSRIETENFQIQQSVSNNIRSTHEAERYKINTRKIAHSYILEEKLKNSQYLKPSVFYRAFQGMNPTLNLSEEFLFNSCFQGGNLDCVIKINERQFDLFLRIDSNTRGHLLWFYFSVKNQDKIGKIIMNICNFSKSKTLYKEGLRPYVFSSIKNKLFGTNWQQQGENLGIQKREFRYSILENKLNSSNTNCMVIEYQFQHPEDEVFFAYCIPYTYSQLMNDVEKLPEKFVERRVLGKSLLGADIPILHITEPEDQSFSQKGENQGVEPSTASNFHSESDQFYLSPICKPKKRVIFATGRIHPSESNSSYVIMGFIKWLCSDKKQAIQLRKIARFVIVPMVNPDGVIIGNSRTSASGKDLNREYINPDPILHPEICLIKQITKKIHEEHQITLFLDFHGHSRKKNTFFYGPVYSISEPNYYKCRILPKLIEKISNPFRFHSCSFNLIQDKKKTARASMFQSLGIQYTYTVQSSIGYFYDSQKLKIFQFSQLQWVKMGESIVQGISQFIVGINSYEQFLKQKRKERLRKKKFIKVPQTKLDYLEDKAFLENQQTEQSLKINYEENLKPKSPQKKKKPNHFLQVLQEIRASSPQKSSEKQTLKQNDKTIKGRYDDPQNLDIDEDSDSHDQNEDMDQRRLKEFAQIVKHQMKSFDSQSKDTEIKLRYEKELKRSVKGKKTQLIQHKIVNEFQLLNENQSLEKKSLRNAKTGDGLRKLSKLNEVHLSHKNHLKKQKSHLEDSSQNKLPEKHKQILTFNFRNTLAKFDEKRNSIIPQKKDKKTIDNTEKREKTIVNYFGEYRLVLEEKIQENETKRQKYDIIRKLQSRRENSRKKRVESQNEVLGSYQRTLTNQSSTFCRKKKALNPPEFIHGPTEFTFSLPFSENSQPSKTYILKPKLKSHLRPKPHSVQNFYSSLNMKQKDSISNIKQQSQKIIQGTNHSQKQMPINQKTSQKNWIQNGGRQFFNRLSHASEKTQREINRSSKIDLEDVKNTVMINTFKVYQM